MFDNIKLFLIFAVVLVHLLATVTRVTEQSIFEYDLICVVLCSFHMPAFMFISGYFSKNLNNTFGKVKTLFIMYAMAQVIIFYTRYLLGLDISIERLFLPAFSMWYLFALIILRAVLPIVEMLKAPPVVLIASVLLSFYVSAYSSDHRMVSTILKLCGFQVFFFVGYYLKPEHVEYIRKLPKLVYLLIGSVMVYGLCQFAMPYGDKVKFIRYLFLRDYPVAGLEDKAAVMMFYGVALVFAILITVVLIGLFPRKKFFLSAWGGNTSLIYVAQACLYFVWFEELRSGLWPAKTLEELCAIAVGLSVGCVLIFGIPFISKAYNSLIKFVRGVVFLEFIYKWILTVRERKELV